MKSVIEEPSNSRKVSSGFCRRHPDIHQVSCPDPSTLDAVDGEGNTALHLACCGAKYDTITMLLEKYDAVSDQGEMLTGSFQSISSGKASTQWVIGKHGVYRELL